MSHVQGRRCLTLETRQYVNTASRRSPARFLCQSLRAIITESRSFPLSALQTSRLYTYPVVSLLSIHVLTSPQTTRGCCVGVAVPSGRHTCAVRRAAEGAAGVCRGLPCEGKQLCWFPASVCAGERMTLENIEERYCRVIRVKNKNHIADYGLGNF